MSKKFTLDDVKHIHFKFFINQELIYKYLPIDEIYLITLLTQEDYVIIKSYVFQGYGILFKELNEEERREFRKKNTEEIEKQLKLFMKNLKSKNEKKLSRNLFYKYNDKSLKNHNFIPTKLMKRYIVMPSLYDVIIKKHEL